MSFLQRFTTKNLSVTNVKNATLQPLSATFDRTKIEVVPIPESITRGKQFASVFENVLSASECESWIKSTESAGYGVALVNVGGGRQEQIKDYRNSSRCIIDSKEIAAQLWERIKHLLPSQIKAWEPVELNERLRFLKYDPGDFFATHCDGCYRRPSDHPNSGDTSYYTLMLYLNEGFDGGSTRFNSLSTEYFDVIPKVGSVLVFEHNMVHSGEVLINGTKYAMRTDVMCRRS